MPYNPYEYTPPSLQSFRLKGHTLQQAKKAREHDINSNARLRSQMEEAAG